MTTPNSLPSYRWPNLSPVQRQYLVCDDQGRFGLAHPGSAGVLLAHPLTVRSQETAPSTLELPANAIIITETLWRLQPDGTYTGYWYDALVPTYPVTVPPEMIRKLQIVDDLGWRMPDHWADIALAGSDKGGHWDYGATLGKVGGEPPVKGQKSVEMTIAQAVAYAHEVGTHVTGRALRLACNRGDIPGSRKIGRDWLITYAGMNHYLDNRPKRGPKVVS